MAIALKESVIASQIILALTARLVLALPLNTIIRLTKHVVLLVPQEHILINFRKLASPAYPHALDVSIIQQNAQAVNLVPQPFISTTTIATHPAHLPLFYYQIPATIAVHPQSA